MVKGNKNTDNKLGFFPPFIFLVRQSVKAQEVKCRVSSVSRCTRHEFAYLPVKGNKTRVPTSLLPGQQQGRGQDPALGNRSVLLRIP